MAAHAVGAEFTRVRDRLFVAAATLLGGSREDMILVAAFAGCVSVVALKDILLLMIKREHTIYAIVAVKACTAEPVQVCGREGGVISGVACCAIYAVCRIGVALVTVVACQRPAIVPGLVGVQTEAG